MKLHYYFVSLLLIFSTTFLSAEDISQSQTSIRCSQSFVLASPAHLSDGQSAVVNVNLPNSNRFRHRFTFTPDYSGELSVEFTGGSNKTTWLLGNRCGSKAFFKASKTSSHTQTIQVTAGVTIFGSVYDWTQSSDIQFKFTRGSSGPTDPGGDADIIQTQADIRCSQSFTLTSPASLAEDHSTTVKVDLPQGTRFRHRFKFTPNYSGELNVEFTGGSNKTTWLLGNRCGSKTFFKASKTSSHTQTIQVTAGVTIFGSVYDWTQSSDIQFKFSRGSSGPTDPGGDADIIQTQADIRCSQSFTFATPATLLEEQSTTINVDLPQGTRFRHRFKFTPSYSGELNVEFTGGSNNTHWLMGSRCGSGSYFKARRVASHTQTIQISAGETVYGVVYDWSQSSDIRLKFSRGSGVVTPPSDNIYVSTTGNDTNDGSVNRPYKTITEASKHATAGQTVVIAQGTYYERVLIETSGEPQKPITYLGVKNKTIISGAQTPFPPNDDGGQFLVSGASHIVLDGITVVNTKDHAIAARAGNTQRTIKDITIRHCKTDKSYGSGIIVYGSDPFVKYQVSGVLIEDNIVLEPQKGAFIAGRNLYDEDITVGGGVSDFIIRGNLVDARNQDFSIWEGGPLGIDAKNGVRQGKIYKNHVKNIPSQGIYVDGYAAGASDIEVYQNIVHHISAYGLIVNAEMGGTVDNIKFYNNVVYDVNWGGIAIDDYLDPAFPAGATPAPKTNISIFNNTVVGLGIYTSGSSSGKIYNNVVNATNPLDINGNYAVNGNCIVSPQFASNYHLLSTSPCVDTGISAGAPNVDYDGKPRPSGAGIDAGAFEFQQ